MSLDDAQKRKIMEALQDSHRRDWQKQVGLRPLDTKPLPELIAQATPEPAEPEAIEAEPKNYELEAEQAQQRDVDNPIEPYSTKEEAPPEQLAVYKAVNDEWGKGLEPQAPPQAPQEPKSDIGVRYEVRRKEPPPPPAEPKDDKAKEPEPVSMEAKPQPVEKRDADQKVQPQAAQQPAEPKRERMTHGERRQAIVEKYRKDFQENAKRGSRFGDMPWARVAGGNTPDMAGNANAVASDGSYGAFADAGSHFAASVASALEKLTQAMVEATDRIKAIEKVLDDGAS